MKKRWIIFALVSALLLTGCGKKKDNDKELVYPETPIPALTEAPTWPTEAPDLPEDGTDGTGDSAETETGTPEDSTEAVPEETQAETAPKEDPDVDPVDETVYAVAKVNVRSGPGFNHGVIGQLHAGDSVKRTGIGRHGWSRITYEGKTAYVANNYVTPDSPETAGGATYQEVNQTVKATAKVNIRKGPGVDYDILGQLQAGEEVKRTGIGSKGWSRITYDGKTVYVSNNYLKVVTKEAVPEKK